MRAATRSTSLATEASHGLPVTQLQGTLASAVDQRRATLDGAIWTDWRTATNQAMGRLSEVEITGVTPSGTDGPTPAGPAGHAPEAPATGLGTGSVAVLAASTSEQRAGETDPAPIRMGRFTHSLLEHMVDNPDATATSGASAVADSGSTQLSFTTQMPRLAVIPGLRDLQARPGGCQEVLGACRQRRLHERDRTAQWLRQ